MFKKGSHWSPEMREKIIKKMRGRKRPDVSGKNSPFFGKNHSGKNSPSWKGGELAKRRRYREKQESLHPEISRYWGMTARARAGGIPINITRKEFDIWFSNEQKICSYCGRNIWSKAKLRGESLSIDRKHNEVGYVVGNLCLACNRCNSVKSNVFTYTQMKEIADKYLREKFTSV